MENSIQFKAPKNLTQQTLLFVLKKYKYYFKAITPYENTRFNIVLVKERNNPFDKVRKKLSKKAKPHYYETTLMIGCDSSSAEFDVNGALVVTQDEIKYFYSQVPENYVGLNNL